MFRAKVKPPRPTVDEVRRTIDAVITDADLGLRETVELLDGLAKSYRYRYATTAPLGHVMP